MHHDPVLALKARMTREVQRLMDGWDTPELLCLVRTSASRVSKLRTGKTNDVSLGRLIQIAAQLGGEVRITVTERRGVFGMRRPSGGVSRKA